MQSLLQRPAALRTSRTVFSSRNSVNRRRLHVCNMFTGIVQGLAEVTAVDRKQDFASMRITFPDGKMDGVQLGASVAINGTCLTVTDITGNTLGFDIVVETLRATSLGDLQVGSRVNFERSARVGDEIGGHNVSGHVHFKACIHSVERTENNQKVTFAIPDDRWMKYIFPKGYIAIDGTSLTIGEVYDTFFTVYLIPETLRVTVFGFKKEGDFVNIEVETQTQAIVDTVERVVARYMAKA